MTEGPPWRFPCLGEKKNRPSVFRANFSFSWKRRLHSAVISLSHTSSILFFYIDLSHPFGKVPPLQKLYFDPRYWYTSITQMDLAGDENQDSLPCILLMQLVAGLKKIICSTRDFTIKGFITVCQSFTAMPRSNKTEQTQNNDNYC